MSFINDYNKNVEIKLDSPKSVFSNICINPTNYENVKKEYYAIQKMLDDRISIKSSTIQSILARFNLNFGKCNSVERITYRAEYKIYNDEMCLVSETIMTLLRTFAMNLKLLIDKYENEIISRCSIKYSNTKLSQYKLELFKFINGEKDMNK